MSTGMTQKEAWMASMFCAIEDMAHKARFLPHSNPDADLAAFAGKVLEMARSATGYATSGKWPVGLEENKWKMIAKLAQLPAPVFPTYSRREDFDAFKEYGPAVYEAVDEHILECAKEARSASRGHFVLSAFEELGQLAWHDEGCSGELDDAAEDAEQPYENNMAAE